MEDSVFTKIIKGEIPCHKIYEDDKCLAFLDIYPQVEGHTLLIPKDQIDKLWDVPDELYHYLWSVAKKIESRITEVLNPPRVGIFVEGFGVPHAHIHLIPIYQLNDLKKSQNMQAEPDHGALAKIAEKLAL